MDRPAAWIDPQQPERRILGVDQGALVTLNGGETWSSWFNQPTGQFYHAVSDSQFPYRVYGAQQDSGAAVVPSRTDTIDGINLTHFREIVAGGEADEVAVDPTDPDIVYGGRVDRFDVRTGQTRNVDPTLAFPDQYRGEWTQPLIFSKRNPKALYFANQRIFRTEDGGEHWKPISPDLTRETLTVPPNLDAPTAADHDQIGDRRGVVYSIAPSPLAEGLLWAGTDDGLLWRSADDCGHWENVTPSGLLPWSKITTIEASHFEAALVYAAVDRHRLDDDHPYIYVSRDAGRTWTLRVAGIPADQAVNVVREDPVRPGLLYAGTEKGVWVSIDDGGHWQRLQSGLPVTSVRDLEVHGADLVAATHGRSFWVLDDLGPLRSVSREALAAPLWLAPPTDAVRFRPTEFTGTPMPRDEAIALNPPDGASLYYHLSRPSASPVVLRIEDGRGHVVRSYSSATVEPAPDLQKLQTTPDWVPAAVTVSREAGLHRVVWDLRYHASSGRTTEDPTATGPWAPPGQYQVVLESDGHRIAAPLRLAPDPRVKLPEEAYAREFRAAERIEAVRGQLADALARATRLEKAMTETSGRKRGAGDSRYASLQRRLIEIADPEITPTLRNAAQPPPRVNGLRYLSAQGVKLARAVDGADADPSGDAIAGVEHFVGVAQSALLAWEKFERTLPAPLQAAAVAVASTGPHATP